MGETVSHKEALEGCARQLEIERYAGERELSIKQNIQLVADQGYALRLVMAHGFLGIIEAIEAATQNPFDLPE